MLSVGGRDLYWIKVDNKPGQWRPAYRVVGEYDVFRFLKCGPNDNKWNFIVLEDPSDLSTVKAIHKEKSNNREIQEFFKGHEQLFEDIWKKITKPSRKFPPDEEWFMQRCVLTVHEDGAETRLWELEGYPHPKDWLIRTTSRAICTSTCSCSNCDWAHQYTMMVHEWEDKTGEITSPTDTPPTITTPPTTPTLTQYVNFEVLYKSATDIYEIVDSILDEPDKTQKNNRKSTSRKAKSASPLIESDDEQATRTKNQRSIERKKKKRVTRK